MKIMACQVSNFGSYKDLGFFFANQGLTLVSGATGAGKSTFMDIPPWILFGVTAKNGSVDEIRSWNSSEPTEGRAHIDLTNKTIKVTRIRGTAKDNDLYFSVDGNEPVRGKDLTDTQKLLNNELNMTAETYLAGAYFHEFSQTASFFTTTAKVRRQLTEQIVDLTLANTLTKNIAEYRKSIKKDLNEVVGQLTIGQHEKDFRTKTIETETAKAEKWEQHRYARIDLLEKERYSFSNKQDESIKSLKSHHMSRVAELDYDIADVKLLPDDHFTKERERLRKALQDLPDAKCKECGALKDHEKRMFIAKDLQAVDFQEQANNQSKIQLVRLQNSLAKLHQSLEPAIETIKVQKNTYIDQVKSARREVNPHLDAIETAKSELETIEINLSSMQETLSELTQENQDLDTLSQVTDDFRGACISRSIDYLETMTNKLLTEHFDAEIKVKFDVADADKLDVTITKDGNICTYSQLSKGQRQLLKLCFGVSVMKSVSNHNGAKFSAIFMDELMEGLDEQLKIKAFGLLEQLSTEYESVFAIDHSEGLKNMFTKRYEVSLIDGKSQIVEA